MEVHHAVRSLADSTVSMPPYSYTWIFALTMIVCFIDAFSIGANDVANSFATSVGSRSLKLWQACVIACFTEFGGAVALGATTSSTVKDGIINTKLFEARPDLLMMAFFCALVASSTWVLLATAKGLPVSTTHSIIGALIGVGISGFGFSAVKWQWEGKGVAQIVASWFISPVVAGIIAAFVYLLTVHLVMKSKNSLVRGIYAIPAYFTVTIFIASFYVVTKNGKSTLDIKLVNGKLKVEGDVPLAFGIIGAVTGAVLIFCVAFLCPYFYRRFVKEEKMMWYHMFTVWCTPEQPHDEALESHLKYHFTPSQMTDDDRRALGLPTDEDVEKAKAVAEEEEKTPPTAVQKMKRKLWRTLTTGVTMDVATVQEDNKAAVVAHEVAVLYDNKTEYLYSLLQVVTASLASFAHGSNDVANALGPTAGVYQIWQEGGFSTKADVPIWMLAYGGLGIDCGLALYGYNIMRSLGNNITYHSPSRGFCMELGAALSVITASFLALPVSTTQCIVGATVAVGLCNGQLRAINWWMFAQCFFGWFLTLPFASICSGLLYALLTRGPSFTLPPGF